MSPWSVCPAERGLMLYSPNEQQAHTCGFPHLPCCKSWTLLLHPGGFDVPLGCVSVLCNPSSEPLCSSTEGLLLLLLLLQHRGVQGIPRSPLRPRGTHLPEWMERFCPTYFISWGGPWSHRQRAAHASAALASRSSHTWPGGKEKGRQGFWVPRGGKRGNPLPWAPGGFLSTHGFPKNMTHMSGWKKPRGSMAACPTVMNHPSCPPRLLGTLGARCPGRAWML